MKRRYDHSLPYEFNPTSHQYYADSYSQPMSTIQNDLQQRNQIKWNSNKSEVFSRVSNSSNLPYSSPHIQKLIANHNTPYDLPQNLNSKFSISTSTRKESLLPINGLNTMASKENRKNSEIALDREIYNSRILFPDINQKSQKKLFDSYETTFEDPKDFRDEINLVSGVTRTVDLKQSSHTKVNFVDTYSPSINRESMLNRNSNIQRNYSSSHKKRIFEKYPSKQHEFENEIKSSLETLSFEPIRKPQNSTFRNIIPTNEELRNPEDYEFFDYDFRKIDLNKNTKNEPLPKLLPDYENEENDDDYESPRVLKESPLKKKTETNEKFLIEKNLKKSRSITFWIISFLIILFGITINYFLNSIPEPSIEDLIN